MVSFILQSLELRISKQWFILTDSLETKGYQHNGVFYSAVNRTKNIKTTVYCIQQSLELRISKQWYFYSTVNRNKDIKTMVSFIQQSLELRISKQWFLLFNSH